MTNRSSMHIHSVRDSQLRGTETFLVVGKVHEVGFEGIVGAQPTNEHTNTFHLSAVPLVKCQKSCLIEQTALQ